MSNFIEDYENFNLINKIKSNEKYFEKNIDSNKFPHKTHIKHILNLNNNISNKNKIFSKIELDSDVKL